MHPQIAVAKNALSKSSKMQHQYLCDKNKQTYFSLAKNMIFLKIVHILIKNDELAQSIMT